MENMGKPEAQDAFVEYVVVEASYGLVLAVGLRDPCDCTKIKEGFEKVGECSIDIPGAVMSSWAVLQELNSAGNPRQSTDKADIYTVTLLQWLLPL